MNPIVRNIIAVIVGWIAGSIINMSLIQFGHMILPLDGVDPNDLQALGEAMQAAGFEYFIFPFLAHALGSFAGALVAGLTAVNHKMKFALGVGGFFLLGGIMVSTMIPAPVWFVAVDLIFAYIPTAWIAGRIATPKSN